VPPGVVLGDEVYGSVREFREGVAELELNYSLAVRCTTTVWALEKQPLPPKPWKGRGARATRMRRDEAHQPITAKQLANQLPKTAWREVCWREGSMKPLRSRFAALRVRPAYGDDRKGSLRPEQWMLIEWPEGAEAGGLIAYGPRLDEAFRQCARQVAKLLRGAKVADVPVEQPTRFELVIKTSRPPRRSASTSR